MERLSHGHDEWTLELEGKTVGDILSEYQEVFNLPSDGTVQVNGNTVSSSYVMKEGESMEVVRMTGQKGRVLLLAA